MTKEPGQRTALICDELGECIADGESILRFLSDTILEVTPHDENEV